MILNKYLTNTLRKGTIYLTEKKCCPLWAVIAAIVILAAVSSVIVLVVKKLQENRHYIMGADECGCGCSHADEETDCNGVRYTTDQDFAK